MGKRIRVAKTYHVEYGNTEGFNYKQEEFKDLLNSLGVSVMGEEGADFFECLTSEFDKALQLLKQEEKRILNYKEADNELGYTFFEDIYDAIMALGGNETTFEICYDEIVKVMDNYQRERVADDEYMHFLAY